MSDEARRLLASADRAGKGRKLHPAGRHLGELAIDNHYPARGRQHCCDTLKAAAGRHRVNNHTILAHPLDFAMAFLENECVNFIPLSDSRLNTDAFGNWLIWPGWRYLISCPAVQPAIRPAQARPFRRNHADMVRRKTLAQRAGIECINVFILHTCKTNVTLNKYFACRLA